MNGGGSGAFRPDDEFISNGVGHGQSVSVDAAISQGKYSIGNDGSVYLSRASNRGGIRGGGTNNHFNGFRDTVNPFGLARLAGFLAQPNDQVITALDKSMNNFMKNLSLEGPKDDMMILLIEIIGEKICGETSLLEIQNELMALTADKCFLERIKDFTLKLAYLTSSRASMRFRSNDVPVDRSYIRILNALLAFYGLLSVRMTAYAADNLVPSIQAAQSTNELLRIRKFIDEKSSLAIELRLTKLLEVLQSRKLENEKLQDEVSKKTDQGKDQLSPSDIENLYLTTPEENFWEMDIIPKSEEVKAEEDPFLRPNLASGKYPSNLTYLDVQYRLLREDFMAPLRDSIKEYLTHEADFFSRKRKLPPGTIRFYHDVKLKKVECLPEKTLFSMQFSTSNLKQVIWEKSSRLTTGSLLLLTPDKFDTIYFATVGRRDAEQLPEGIIDIIWEGRLQPKTYQNISFLMIECEVYFESYRHTMKALQEMAKPAAPFYDQPRLDTYKMTKYIVDLTTGDIQPPAYLRNIHESGTLQMDFKMLLMKNSEALKYIQDAFLQAAKEEVDSSSENILEISTQKESLIQFKPPVLALSYGNPLEPSGWPTASDLGMDESQYEALKSAITQEISIIQGPPGTGKTYIGLQIIKLLLTNPRITRRLSSSDPHTQQGLHHVDVRIDGGELLNKFQSPILVVCYTNHALDQFLEGIISIMQSVGIDPRCNLIRVGGRSKVEEIQQHNIREISRYYAENRLFDTNYAQLRRRTRESLTLLQQYRADLKDHVRDLSNLEGIVNFHELWTSMEPDISDYMGSIFSKELNEIFLSPCTTKLIDWLGLSSDEFNVYDFRAEEVIKRWFRYKRPQTVPVEHVDEEKGKEEGLEDGELLHILQARRLEEEINLEDEGRTEGASQIKYSMVCNYQGDVESSLTKLFIEYGSALRISGNQNKLRDLRNDMWQLQHEKTRDTNLCHFLSKVLQAYEKGRIELPKVTEDLLARGHEKHSPLRLSLDEKWAIYFYFIERIKRSILNKIMQLEKRIVKAQKNMLQVNKLGDGIILQQAKVVGMTTTGAAKYDSLLRMMKSRIVIVEEAAEVLESHIVTSITEHCEQLILIGDHKQLRPSTAVYKLAKDYNLDLSLFERLVNNNLSWRYLKAQHRMRPEICKLLVPTIYEDLEDHPSVLQYPSVPGFKKNLYFVMHTELEKADGDSKTKANEYEARYLTKLCRHLLFQGFKPEQITILTAYVGQMFLIKKLMRQEDETCRSVRVTVVDNFQGEENDIILLSLVRSNKDNIIGFLKTDNRICVALSRAKQGMFIVGNMNCLVNSRSKTWEKISLELEKQGSIGESLELTCQIHAELIEISSPEDFQRKSPEGGCTKMCPGVLPNCSHACEKVCHIIDRDHVEYQCRLSCERVCADPLKHPCMHKCFQYPCPPCEANVLRNLPCGHDCQLPCHIEFLEWKCEEIVPRELECRHQVDLECHISTKDYVCTLPVDKTLDCGHVKTLPCNRSKLNYDCHENVDKELACGHMRRMRCIDDPSKYTCQTHCLKQLPCGHEQEVRCRDDLAAVNCQTVLTKTKPDCLHIVEVPCFLSHDPSKWTCVSICGSRLECGHQCTNPCHLHDDPEHINYICKAHFMKQPMDCEKMVKIKCNEVAR